MNFHFAKTTSANGKDLKPNLDPRIYISQHIGWVKSYNGTTEYSVPEPDNYNHAVLSDKPIMCPVDLIQNQVWFRKPRDRLWWSVYYVPVMAAIPFRRWLVTLQVDSYWYSHKRVDIRERRGLLWYKKNQSELTENELLYQRGYYENLRSKYFGDDNKMFDSLVGVPRENMPRIQQVEDDLAGF